MDAPGLAGGNWEKDQRESAMKDALLLHGCMFNEYPRAADRDGYLPKPGQYDRYPCQGQEKPEEQENRRAGNPWEDTFFPAAGIVIQRLLPEKWCLV